ncbi:MAG: decarboxylating 6-phosphogluconate dehydrogenase [Patescibacteria group bacterium]
MKIAVVGLGKMGMQIVRKLVEDGHQIVAHDVSESATAEAGMHGAHQLNDKQAVVNAFGETQLILWLMIPADFVDTALNEWLEIVPSGSIIIDGGNSDFRLTAARSKLVEAKGSTMLDVGTSGGVWGYKNGFSMMVGGNEPAFRTIEPILITMASPSGAYAHFGPSGAGHYVKMVHNAIEYGMMESLAEGYHLLKEGHYKDVDLAKAAEVWQHGSVVTSWLNDLTRQALEENPELEGIDGFVAESGEARWSLEAARAKQIPMPSIEASFNVRLASQKGQVNYATKLLAAMRNKFGGHVINKDI